LTSCLPTKRLYYFDDQVKSIQNLDSTKGFNVHRIKKNDRLKIIVSSPDPTLTTYLNISSEKNSGYLVNIDGVINFPAVGKVKMEGLTTEEASILLKEKLSYLFKDLFININLEGTINYMTGRKGGVLSLTNERLTIIEAVSQMPFIDPYDYRNDIWLIREEDNKRIFEKIDLTSKSIFESPYFYLKNNDFLYVKPGRYSRTLFNSSGPLASTIGIVGSSLATLSLIITLKNLLK
jgi:polysaccharide export outer membrane protein